MTNKSARTVQRWCLSHDIGRRVGGGTWQVSAVAPAMFLDRDAKALFGWGQIMPEGIFQANSGRPVLSVIRGGRE